MLDLQAPTVMRLTDYASRQPDVYSELGYTDKKIEWAYRSFKKSERWFLRSHTQAEFDLKLADLAAQRKKNLLFQDEQGLWTYSGLRPMFESRYGDKARRLYDLPRPRIMPWANTPTKTPRYYQTAAKEALLQASQLGPAGIEMGTGLGKTFIIVSLLKELGLQAVIMSPSVNIGWQIYDELEFHFGKKYVGFFGDGKKEFKKLFTVGVGASLRNLEAGDPAWEHLSKASVFVADESHMCPAETLQSVCFGLCASAPYRFFFSGTQMRSDGLDLVLDAITGPIVYTMTVREGVDQGFLAKPIFRMLWVESNERDRDNNLRHSDDANKMTRWHAFYNPDLNAKAAEVVNKSVSVMDRPALIMIEEYEQFQMLLPHLRYECRFAHGALTKDDRQFVPEQYRDDKPKDLVEKFNRGEFPVLIGTSCIATGTDIQIAKTVVNMRQGKSEVEIRQGVGRGTRRVPGKEDFVYIDFGVKNVEILEKHAKARRKIYDEIYPTYKERSL